MKHAEYIHSALNAIVDVDGPFAIDPLTPDASLILLVKDKPEQPSITISNSNTPEQIELLIDALKRDVEHRGFTHDEGHHPPNDFPHVWIGVETDRATSHKASNVHENRLMAWSLAWLQACATINPHNQASLINCPVCGTLTWNWLADADGITSGTVQTMTCINCETNFNVHVQVEYDGAEPRFLAQATETEQPEVD